MNRKFLIKGNVHFVFSKNKKIYVMRVLKYEDESERANAD
jgi:hypothetical protein